MDFFPHSSSKWERVQSTCQTEFAQVWFYDYIYFMDTAAHKQTFSERFVRKNLNESYKRSSEACLAIKRMWKLFWISE